MSRIINWVFDYQQQIGVVFAIVSAILVMVSRRKAKKAINQQIVGTLVVAALAGYVIPQGALLFYCCFDIAQLHRVEALPLYLGIGGMSAILLSVLGVIDCLKDKEE
jgi:hypothetical protein